jgi:hypothetical protein
LPPLGLHPDNWTRTGADGEFEKLQKWWYAHEEQLLIEMPNLKDDRVTYIRHTFGALGVEGELDEVLSERALDAKAAAAIEIVDSLGYRTSHDVHAAEEYEWLKKSLEAGREKRMAKLEEVERSLGEGGAEQSGS